MLTALFFLAIVIGVIQEIKPLRIMLAGDRYRKHPKRTAMIAADKQKS